MTIDPKIHWALHLILGGILCAVFVIHRNNISPPVASSTEKTLNVSKQQTSQDTQKTEQKVVQNSTTTRTETRKNGTQIRTVTRTGTQIDTRKQEERKEQEDVRTSVKEVSKNVPILSTKTAYSLALSWTPLRLEPIPYLPSQATLGARLGQLPIFLEVTAPIAKPSFNQLMLGIRMEF